MENDPEKKKKKQFYIIKIGKIAYYNNSWT